MSCSHLTVDASPRSGEPALCAKTKTARSARAVTAGVDLYATAKSAFHGASAALFSANALPRELELAAQNIATCCPSATAERIKGWIERLHCSADAVLE